MKAEDSTKQDTDSEQDTQKPVSFRLPPRVVATLREVAKVEGTSQISLIAEAVTTFHSKIMRLRENHADEEAQAKLRVEKHRINGRLAGSGANRNKVKGQAYPVFGTKMSASTFRLVSEINPLPNMRGRVVAIALADYLSDKGCSVMKWDPAAVELFTMDLPTKFREEQNKLLVRPLGDSEYPLPVGEVRQYFRGYDVVLGAGFIFHLFGGEDRIACEVLEQTRKVCRSLSLTTPDVTEFIELAVRAYDRSKNSSPVLYPDEGNSLFRAFVASRVVDFLGAGIDEIPVAPSDVLHYYNHLDTKTEHTPASIVATMRARQISRLRFLNVYWTAGQVGYCFKNFYQGCLLRRVLAAL